MGVILYTCRNCCCALSVGVPDAFLRACFNVSSKRSAWSFDFGWYCSVVMCFMWKISQNSLNSTYMIWLPLSLTTQSNTPNAVHWLRYNKIPIYYSCKKNARVEEIYIYIYFFFFWEFFTQARALVFSVEFGATTYFHKSPLPLLSILASYYYYYY